MAWAAALSIGGGALLSGMGGKKSDKAGKKAAKKMAEESKKAMEAINNEATAAYGEQKGLMQPWYDAGKEALGELTAGIKSGKFDPGQFHFDYASFEKDPGYQFRVDQGERSMERGAAARGKLLSGQQQKALLGYGQDMGSQEYQNTFNRAAQEWGMNANRLQNNYNMLNSLNQQGFGAGQNIANYRNALTGYRTGAIGDNAQNQMGMQNMIGQINQREGDRMSAFGGQLMGYGMSSLGGGMGGSAGAKSQQPPAQEPPASGAYDAGGNYFGYQ
jgi:hypothetical protein